MYLFLIAFAVIFWSVSPVQANSDSLCPADDELISWLPPNIETLTVTKGPFRIPASTKNEDNTLDLRYFSLGDSGNLGEKGNLCDKTIIIAVEGARDFRPPSGNTLSVYDGSHITVFKDSVGIVLNDYCDSTYKFDGVEVGWKKIDWGFEQGKVYLAIPRKNVLVIATSEEFMQTTLTRMSSKFADRAMPPNLPEWTRIQKNSRFYAIRHYQANTRDWESPLHKSRGRDKEAVGLAVCAQKFQPSKIDLWYFSKNSKPSEAITEMLGSKDDGRNLNLSIAKASKDCWRFRVGVPDDQQWAWFAIVFSSLLGHTPYF